MKFVSVRLSGDLIVAAKYWFWLVLHSFSLSACPEFYETSTKLCQMQKEGRMISFNYCILSPQEKRRCSSATVLNHISSILYPIKFLLRKDAPLFNNVPIIQQLRVQATLLQKEGDLERLSSKEELDAQNRWLPWWVWIVSVYLSTSGGTLD